jgi:hypothetical protein
VQTLAEQLFELQPPGGLFDDTTVRNARPELSDNARRALLHRSVKHGEILRLKPGIYCLAPRLRRSPPHPFVAAMTLHSPAQVSFESALAYHGLIPEAVYGVVCSTLQRSRTFTTPLGSFEFVRVPVDTLRAGVRARRVDPQTDGWAFIASPLRALADLLYTRREVSWEGDGLRFVEQSLRIELDELAAALDDLPEVLATQRNKRVRRYLEGLRQELGQ